MQFKINAQSSDSELAIKKEVLRKFPNAAMNFELLNTGKVLHVHGVPEDSEHAAQVESAIKEAGFEGAWLTRGLENK